MKEKEIKTAYRNKGNRQSPKVLDLITGPSTMLAVQPHADTVQQPSNNMHIQPSSTKHVHMAQ